MFNKMRSILGKTTLERVGNIARVMTAISVTILALVFLFFANYEYFDDKIEVIGEANVEISKIDFFYIEVKNKNENGVNLIMEVKEKLKSEFKDFYIDDEIYKKNNYNEKRPSSKFEFSIYFKNKNDKDVFKKFIDDNFKDRVNISSASIKDENFQVDKNVLIEKALEDAKNKAEKIAEKSNRKLGKIIKADEDPYLSNYDNSDKNDFITKRIKVIYRLK